ncbi:MAG: hypothetical protein R2708_18165 [Vicinamibacterales bacterium]
MLRHAGRRMVSGLALAALVGACSSAPPAPARPGRSTRPITAALDGIQQPDQGAHERARRRQAEGRAPGTAGYEGALQHVEQNLTAHGLAPAGEGGGGSACRSGTARWWQTAAASR